MIAMSGFLELKKKKNNKRSSKSTKLSYRSIFKLLETKADLIMN